MICTANECYGICTCAVVLCTHGDRVLAVREEEEEEEECGVKGGRGYPMVKGEIDYRVRNDCHVNKISGEGVHLKCIVVRELFGVVTCRSKRHKC